MFSEKIKHHLRTFSLFFTGAINLLYITASLLSGLFYRSIWYFSLTLCHLVLLSSRGYLFFVTKNSSGGEGEKSAVSKIAVALLALNFLSLSLSVYSLAYERGVSYGRAALPVFTVYTVYSLLLSVYGIFISGKKIIPTYIAYRNLTLTTALISLYNLVYSSLHTFLDESWAVAVVSFSLSIIFTLSMSLSVYLLAKRERCLR